jgi:hypothetical protein
MYRYTRKVPLTTGQQYGAVIRDGDLKPKVIEKFLATGTLIKISTPPLSEIPAYEKRSKELLKASIQTIEDLIECNATEVAKKLNKSTVTIRRWQSEAMQWLMPERKQDSN